MELYIQPMWPDIAGCMLPWLLVQNEEKHLVKKGLKFTSCFLNSILSSQEMLTTCIYIMLMLQYTDLNLLYQIYFMILKCMQFEYIMLCMETQ